MPITIVFETHSLSEDNERGIASGWGDCALSARGRSLALELGERRRNDDIDTVFCSDLRRARETAEIAFKGSKIPVFFDWRLRECNYGLLNEQKRHERQQYLDKPYPNGESWRQALGRVERFFQEVELFWEDKRILVIGHVATKWAFDQMLNSVPLEISMQQDFDWREGWVYTWSGQ